MCLYFCPHNILELNGKNMMDGISMADLKKKVEILIIDDNPFTFLPELLKRDFLIKQKNDLTDLSDAAVYSIVLCDIRGVGKTFGEKYEGAFLIKELKTKYPSMKVVAYTANDYEPSFQKYLEYADMTVPKGGYEVEDWTALLEQLIKDSVNPVTQWEHTRTKLLKAGVTTANVAKYESQYVRAVQRGEIDTLKKTFERKKPVGYTFMIDLLSEIVVKAMGK